jgi:MFS family permease
VHGLGWALFSSPNMTVIMNSVPPDGRSIASALGAMARSLGMLSGMLVTALLISLSLGNQPVDQHPVEFIGIMSQAFWFLTVATAAILIVCIREGRARRSPGA